MKKVLPDQGFKTFFVLNSHDHEIYPAHIYLNAKCPTSMGGSVFSSD